MLTLYTALMCGLVGTFAAGFAYVRSNQFVLGEDTRPERHRLWDPLGFAAIGGLFGFVVGVVFTLWLAGANPIVPIAASVGGTLGGIASIGAIVTWKRYRALPRDPALAGPRRELEFELRLPAGHATDAPLPQSGVMGYGVVHATDAVLAPPVAGAEGRIVVPGRVRLRFAVANRLLSILDGRNCWVNFDIALPAEPTVVDAWTDWFAPCNPDPRVPPAQDFQLRVRVQPARGR